MEKSKQLSKVRIHVERIIGLLNKRFTVLKGTLPIAITRKMVPITRRARSFLKFQKQNREKGGQNNNNRPTNLPKVITFSTDYKYTPPNLSVYHTQ